MVREDGPVLQTGSAPSPCVSVIIPARNEAGTVGTIVEAIVGTGRVEEVVVVDDGSNDATAVVAAAAGGRVVRASHGPGKGAAMRDGVKATSGEVIVFCDGDLEQFDPSFITTLASALAAARDGIVMVKATYRRAGAGGRVTELVGRPALELLHPYLAHITQPLGGEYAVRRAAIERVPFVRGYGVELGLLIDLARMFGASAIAEVDLGVRYHRNRPLADLSGPAREVLAVALERAGVEVNVDELPPPGGGSAVPRATGVRASHRRSA